jgi:hypothetical protein
MAQLARLPNDLVFYTQITMEAAEDGSFSMRCGGPTSVAHWSASGR